MPLNLVTNKDWSEQPPHPTLQTLFPRQEHRAAAPDEFALSYESQPGLPFNYITIINKASFNLGAVFKSCPEMTMKAIIRRQIGHLYQLRRSDPLTSDH